jgi:succinoglycan biosynthesis transport protein ExoP
MPAMPPEPKIYELSSPHGLPPAGVAATGDPSLDAGGPPSLDLGALLRCLLRGWWIIALAVLAAVGAAVVWLRVTPPTYESMATVRVEQERRPLLPGSSAAGGGEDIRALEMVKTIEQGLVSQNNLRRVLESQKLAADPTFAKDRTEAGLLWALTKKVRSELRRGTRLIDVRVADTDPARARRLAASLVEEYMAATNLESMASARAKSVQLQDNVRRLEGQIQETEARIQAYREQHRGLPLDKEASLPAEKVRDLATRLAKIVEERTRLEAARKEIAALGPNPAVDAVLKVQGDVAGEDVTSLKSTLAEKEAEFARLQQRYLARHPKYIQAATELASLRRQLNALGTQAASTLAAAAAQLAATERGLRDQMVRAESEALAVERVAGPYRLMHAQLASDQTSFDALQAQLKLAEVAAVAAPAAVALADAPVEASRPSKPNKKLVVALAGFAGGVSGLGLVFLGALVRRRYDSAEEIERALRLPALAVIPSTGVSTRSLALLDNPRVERACAQAFRALRTALSLMSRGAEGRTTVFISARTGEGTSFVAANHALSLARQGYRTLLIDGNLHAPSLDHVFFAGRNADGLANYLEGRAAAGQACRPTHVSELFLLSAGEAAGHPSELFSAAKLQLLIEDAGRWFHRVVIDAPALDRANDGLVMGRLADQLVLVVNARTATRRASVDGLRRLALAGLRPVGFVCNESSRGTSVWQPAAPSRSRFGLSLRS